MFVAVSYSEPSLIFAGQALGRFHKTFLPNFTRTFQSI